VQLVSVEFPISTAENILNSLAQWIFLIWLQQIAFGIQYLFHVRPSKHDSALLDAKIKKLRTKN
jgi:hypothetical protein